MPQRIPGRLDLDQVYNDTWRGWPVRPHRRQHPIRGSFLDPRPDPELGAIYHDGVDIAVRDDRPEAGHPPGRTHRVFAIEGGQVRVVAADDKSLNPAGTHDDRDIMSRLVCDAVNQRAAADGQGAGAGRIRCVCQFNAWRGSWRALAAHAGREQQRQRDKQRLHRYFRPVPVLNTTTVCSGRTKPRSRKDDRQASLF